jgi:glycosyltransferase involved in cell wall biosynthesis
MALTILHISTRLIQGGSQENTILSCEGQAALGHDVHLAYGPIYGPEGSYFDRAHDYVAPNGKRITMHEVPHMVRQIAPMTDLRGYRELRALIEELKPDVVHTHSSKAGVIGRAAAWKVHKKSHDNKPAVVHTIHGPPFHRYLSKRKNAIYILSEQFAAKRCHVIASVADAMTDQFRQAKIGRADQFVTVRSGMETEHFLSPIETETREAMRAELGFNDDDFVIGTVARLAEHKGHDDLLDALGEDLKANPSWKLLWVGDGWWSERLLDRVKEMGLTQQVVATGLVPGPRVAAMMRAMDVLLHPSYREGLPRTVPQALLCSVPVVASDADGTREACLDPSYLPDVDHADATGILFPIGDAKKLRDGIRWMSKHQEERRRMGERGRVMCSSMFATQTMVDDLEVVYQRAIGLAQGGGSMR